MKITFVLVCAIALSLSFDAVNCCLRFRDFIDGQQEFIDHRERPTKTPDASDDSPEAKHIRVPRSTEFRHSHPHAPNDQSLNTNPVKEHFSPTNFSRTLLEQKNNLMADIAQVWRECNEQFNVPWSTALKFFEKSPKHIRDTNDNNEKKLVDCTLRGMGVITDKGFQAEQYLVQIRKLLLSYTSFDINQQSSETQWLVRQTIAFELVKHFHKRENCFASDTRLIDALQFDTSNQPDNRKSIPSFLIPAICNELIQSYEEAVRECKDKKDAKGKSFKTTWMIVQCISKGNLDRMFESAFYPGMLHKAMREANKA